MSPLTLIRLSSLALALILSSGCSYLLDATSDKPVNFNPGKRSLGAAIDDENIETMAKVNLRKASPSLSAADIEIFSYNGLVLLTGQVSSAQDRQEAARVVQSIGRVRQVHNELMVQGENSLLAEVNNSWVATKVKTQLIAHQDIEAGRIKVISENGVVYLMGLVTQIEADKVVDVVRSTTGVNKIVKVFEYID